MMTGVYFADLNKNRTTTPTVSVTYGAKYPVETVIVYNKFNNDDITKLHKAMEDIKVRYGKKWGLWGEDDKNGEFNVLNNLLSDTPPEGYKVPRVMANTKKVRFLYEWDNLSLEQQSVYTKQLIQKGVLQRAVFSGSKSIHHIIELWSTREPQNKEEYKFMHQFIAKSLGLVGYDTQCTDSSRLTRANNVYRKEKGKWQELIFYSNENRFKCDEWYDYFLAEKKNTSTDASTKLLRIIDSIKDLNKGADHKFVANYIRSEEKKGSFNDGNRHANVPRIVAALKLKGKLSLEEVQSVLEPYLENLDNQDLWISIEKLYNGAE